MSNRGVHVWCTSIETQYTACSGMRIAKIAALGQHASCWSVTCGAKTQRAHETDQQDIV